MNRRRSDHGPALYAYTAAIIFLAALACAWVATTYPIDEAISLTMAGGSEGILLGLVFWIALGLLGGTRVQHLRGHGVLTFHLPFIIAAMALGGPAAGAVVAVISTTERREFREAPWYGVLANHAGLALAAIAGGVTLVLVRDGVTAWLPGASHSVELAAIAAGSLVLAVVVTAIVGGIFILRDRLTVREAIRVYDTAYRSTAAAEVVLGWMLYLSYTTIGWWAALVAALLVLTIWQAHEATEMARHDALSGLLSRAGFEARFRSALDSVERRGHTIAILAIDLDGFKAVNDTHGHAVGDEVIREVGTRLRAGTRLTDVAGRRGGDEFSVVLTDVPDRATAEQLAGRLYDQLCASMQLDDRVVQVGASIGVYVLAPADRLPAAGRLHTLTDRLMYQAKEAGGGLRVEGNIGP